VSCLWRQAQPRVSILSIDFPVIGLQSLVVSGAQAFQLLSPEEQEFALNTVIEYAPRAYEWIQNCKATSDGLSIPVVGDEKAGASLTPWDPDKVQALPVSIQFDVQVFRATNASRWSGKI
jgi:hypothetical protein